MKTLGSIFGSSVGNTKIPDRITDGVVTRVNIINEVRLITLWVHFSELIPLDDLIRTEKLYAKSLDSSVVIKPHFGRELFTVRYFPELYKAARREIPSINGTLNNADVKQDGKNLRITLYNGGKAILDAKGFDGVLLRLIAEQFDLSFNLIYDGLLEMTEDNTAYQQQMQNAQKQVQRQQLEQAVQTEAADAEVSENVRAKQQEAAATETEIREGKFATPQLIESSIRPLYGRNIRGKMIPINITDYTGSTTVKVFNTIRESAVVDSIRKGDTIAVMGDVEYDKYAGELVVNARAIGTAEKVKVVDKAPEKRVELHLHTNMSQMDALTPASELVKRAAAWGHKAIAITDHGVAQAFPDAMNAAERINKDGEKIKVLYGTEAYFVDDLVESVSGEQDEPLSGTFICFDIETTGLSPLKDKITEIGAVKIENGAVTDIFSTFANPEMPIPAKIVQLTGITDAMVKDAPSQSEAVSAFLEFAGDSILVAHNAPFDTSFIRKACENMGVEYNYTSIDTVAISRAILPDIKNVKLDTVANYLRLGKFNHHRATDDADMLSKIFVSLCGRLEADYDIHSTAEINTKIAGGDFKKLPTHHQIILAKNNIGLKNLYKLISKSHLETLYKKLRGTALQEHSQGRSVGRDQANRFFLRLPRNPACGQQCIHAPRRHLQERRRASRDRQNHYPSRQGARKARLRDLRRPFHGSSRRGLQKDFAGVAEIQGRRQPAAAVFQNHSRNAQGI